SGSPIMVAVDSAARELDPPVRGLALGRSLNSGTPRSSSRAGADRALAVASNLPARVHAALVRPLPCGDHYAEPSATRAVGDDGTEQRGARIGPPIGGRRNACPAGAAATDPGSDYR